MGTLAAMPEYRRLPCELHDAMVDCLWSNGLSRLWLTTQPGTRAQRFYEDAGWICVGEAEHGQVRYEMARPG